MQCNATQYNATQRNAMQRNATQYIARTRLNFHHHYRQNPYTFGLFFLFFLSIFIFLVFLFAKTIEYFLYICQVFLGGRRHEQIFLVQNLA
jgi:hypothetical protein